jgi:DNA repair protein RadA/Sms
MVEEIAAEAPRSQAQAGGDSRQPLPLSAVLTDPVHRLSTGIAEVDRVLGGGIVPGAFMLLGGDPGIGKSTLLLQIAGFVSRSGPVLYVTAEESEAQIRLRAERLGLNQEALYILAQADVRRIVQALTAQTWTLAVVDSLQTAYQPDLESAPGSVSQVRAVATELMRVAKRGCPLFLVGHVNKEGSRRPAA